MKMSKCQEPSPKLVTHNHKNIFSEKITGVKFTFGKQLVKK